MGTALANGIELAIHQGFRNAKEWKRKEVERMNKRGRDEIRIWKSSELQCEVEDGVWIRSFQAQISG